MRRQIGATGTRHQRMLFGEPSRSIADRSIIKDPRKNKLMIFTTQKSRNPNLEIRNKSQIRKSNVQNILCSRFLKSVLGICFGFRDSDFKCKTGSSYFFADPKSVHGSWSFGWSCGLSGNRRPREESLVHHPASSLKRRPAIEMRMVFCSRDKQIKVFDRLPIDILGESR